MRFAAGWMILLVLSGQTPGQPREPWEERTSHIRVNEEGSAQGIEAALAERLRLSRETQASQKVISELMQKEWFRDEVKKMQEQIQKDPEFRERLMQQFRNNPQLRDTVEQAIRENKFNRPDGDSLVEQLRKQSREMLPDVRPGPADGPGPALPPNGERPMPDPMQPAPAAPPPPPPPPKKPTWWEKEIHKQLENFSDVLEEEGLGSSLLRSILRDMDGRGFSWRMPLGGKLPESPFKGLSEAMPDVGKWVPWDRIGGSMPSIDLGKSLPDMPQIGSLPDVSFSAPDAPSAGSVGDAFALVVWLVVGGVVVLLLWKMRDLFHRDGADEVRPWRLGRWPVRPGQVTTREELIRAFEYLACLLLGSKGAYQHHHELAEEMAEKAPEHRESAHRLARLYEQARYTPDTDPLAADEVATARNDLSLLAGGAA